MGCQVTDPIKPPSATRSGLMSSAGPSANGSGRASRCWSQGCSATTPALGPTGRRGSPNTGPRPSICRRGRRPLPIRPIGMRPPPVGNFGVTPPIGVVTLCCIGSRRFWRVGARSPPRSCWSRPANLMTGTNTLESPHTVSAWPLSLPCRRRPLQEVVICSITTSRRRWPV